VVYTHHAKEEMRVEESGRIKEYEVFQAIRSGEIIEHYPDDKPYTSVLIFGRTSQERPIHLVCAYSEEDDLAIVITAYQPEPSQWIDYRRRK
jgi:hypothetical protein